MADDERGESRRAEDDPNVIAALKEGRHAEDIWLIECESCGWVSYWNEGSHASCRNCGANLMAITDEAYTLADYWAYELYPCDDARVWFCPLNWTN